MAAALAAAAATAAPAGTGPGEPVLTPTSFTVNNALGATLHGFRIRTGYRRWALVGDLPEGSSRFTILSPSEAEWGTYEFVLGDAPDAADDYTMGAYTRSHDGPVFIDLGLRPASVDGRPVDAPRGSFVLAPAAGREPGSGWFAGEARLALLQVPRAVAGESEFMACGGVGVGLSLMQCRSSSLNYLGMGFGLHLGAMAGYFWSDLTPEELMSLFPVGLYTVGVVVGYWNFFADVPGSEQKSGVVGHFVGVGPDAGLAVEAAGGFRPAGVSLAPKGSFLASCGDVAYDEGSTELSARCANAAGTALPSVLSYASCLGSDVANEDGVLRCEKPPGSYARSCEPVRYRDGVLQARCERADARATLDSRLDVAASCEPGTGVSNIDGRLSCDQPWKPPGPYRANCSSIRYADGVLQADCGGLDTRGSGIRLDYAARCRPRSEVGFSPGYAGRGSLYCLQPD